MSDKLQLVLSFVLQLLKKRLSMTQGVKFAYIQEFEIALCISNNAAFSTCCKVEIDNRKLVRPLLHQVEKTRRKHMYSSKSQHSAILNLKIGPRTFHLSCCEIGPTHKLHLIVEQKVALSFALAHKQHSVNHVSVFFIKGQVVELSEIKITQNVYIMNKYWRRRIKQRSSLLYSATRI